MNKGSNSGNQGKSYGGDGVAWDSSHHELGFGNFRRGAAPSEGSGDRLRGCAGCARHPKPCEHEHEGLKGV